jgi:hypothetical protein
MIDHAHLVGFGITDAKLCFEHFHRGIGLLVGIHEWRSVSQKSGRTPAWARPLNDL